MVGLESSDLLQSDCDRLLLTGEAVGFRVISLLVNSAVSSILGTDCLRSASTACISVGVIPFFSVVDSSSPTVMGTGLEVGAAMCKTPTAKALEDSACKEVEGGDMHRLKNGSCSISIHEIHDILSPAFNPGCPGLSDMIKIKTFPLCSCLNSKLKSR